MAKKKLRNITQKSEVGFRVDGKGRKVQASYEAAQTTRRAMDMWASAGVSGPNTELAAAHYMLVQRSRWEVQNNPSAYRARSVVGTWTVGTGIVPSIPVPEVAQLWEDWIPRADADENAVDFYSLQLQAMNEIFTGGEVLGRLRRRLTTDGYPVPLQVQLIPTEYMPIADWARPGDAKTVCGMEYDAIGRRIAYWMYNRHPRELMAASERPVMRRVPAEDVLHSYIADDVGLSRGVPWLSRVLITLHDIIEYLDAEMVRKKTAALLSVILTDPAPQPSFGLVDGSDPNGGQVDDEINTNVPPLSPGAMIRVANGTSVEVVQPADVGGQFDAFIKQQFLLIAQGLGIPYELLTENFGQLSDRTARLIFKAFERDVVRWQRQLIADICRPVWRAWLHAAIESGAWKPKSDEELRSVQEVRWIAPPFPHINPKQEAETNILNIAAGLKSRKQVVAEGGGNFRATVREIAEDKALFDEFSIPLSFDPRGTREEPEADASTD